MNHNLPASGAASAPRWSQNTVRTGGLTPNGTYFSERQGASRRYFAGKIAPTTPVASAIPLKVSAIGLTPPRSPVAWMLLLSVVAGLLIFAQPAHAQNSVRSSTPRLTPNERRFLWPIDHRLATRLNSKENPADRDTWYVLMFRDIARAETETTTAIERRAVKVDGAMVIQGRTQAAMTVAQFLTKSNTAVDAVAANVPRGSQLNQSAANKLWEYRAFRTEFEAKAFLATLFPPAASESPGSLAR